MSDTEPNHRYFVTYSGTKLPVRLVDPIDVQELTNRNTYIRASFSATGQLSSWEKWVYGRVELAHRYFYSEDGGLLRAVIETEDESTTLELGAGATRVRPQTPS